MRGSCVAFAMTALLMSGSLANAANVSLSEDELLKICNSQDQKMQFAGKMFVMGVLEVARSNVVPANMRICPKGGKTASQYLADACDWIAADQNRHTSSAMLAVIASVSSEACAPAPNPSE